MSKCSELIDDHVFHHVSDCVPGYTPCKISPRLMNTFSIDDQLVFIIDRLNTAINVCHEAPENEDQGYAYATGYSRSAMSDTADDLSKIVEQIREGLV